jgi:hypothetical protein
MLARSYDTQAGHCYPALFASRRNYDVVQGRNAQGRLCRGVLEQSWRAGGASVAEIAALEAFSADPALRTTRAATQERYGPDAPAPPPGLDVVFKGEDAEVGFVVKSGGVIAHGHP